MRHTILAACVCLSVAEMSGAATPPVTPAPAAGMSAGEARALVDRYCVTCHNQRTKAADLLLDQAHLDRVAPDAGAWEKVVKKLKAGLVEAEFEREVIELRELRNRAAHDHEFTPTLESAVAYIELASRLQARLEAAAIGA